MPKVFVIDLRFASESGEGQVLLADVNLSPDSYFSDLYTMVDEVVEDKKYFLFSEEGWVLYKDARVEDAYIQEEGKILVVKQEEHPKELPVPEDNLNFFKQLAEHKLDKQTLESWFLEEVAKMGEPTQDRFMEQMNKEDSDKEDESAKSSVISSKP
eukprot:CAMPEP_0197633316 /NCGR_PEP_ID=MMETSP1338-20131121/9711_1 /TAXON_ID=43686 ORGANISM="Pelagodinium beii, Strain RCC1491" /NCGR_SAMPLE_ID=MMETSP1338 /ASSEMBLY_ACC=CAM_ASM_000754 /LENGTH=155 /DNA_ID=CAMNT_0043204955 /DNA_START=86 /DNA_END=553 /DNA_ORIENTATION=-